MSTKNTIPPEMYDAAKELFRRKRIVTPSELDEALVPLVTNVPADEKIPTGRGKRENLVDWVKATLTRGGFIQKAKLHGTDYYLWLPGKRTAEYQGDVVETFTAVMSRVYGVDRRPGNDQPAPDVDRAVLPVEVPAASDATGL